jgi:L-seryl-tRNA(Ser) seleniumtransferase
MSEQNLAAEKSRLPAVGKLLEHPRIIEALSAFPRSSVVDALRRVLTDLRATTNGTGTPGVEEIVERAIALARSSSRQSLGRAINATGIVLHTGLGRAVLSAEAQSAVAAVAAGHSTLEVDTETGRRGSRQDHVAELLCELTGAESAFVVNNNAGATFLGVTALAAGREVILSRGEMVEIGGSFRMPDIIRASGAKMVEIGTTNRTRLVDYESAITESTGLLLRCHPSNFRVVGFTEEVGGSELAALGQRHRVPVMDDLGSGAIVDTALLGAGPTVTLRKAVASGCDLVTASGDKLLGGPQAGIILGKKAAVQRIAQHPLARAMRIDKLSLAALEATLRLYRDPDVALRSIPTLRYLGRRFDELTQLAQALHDLLKERVGERARINLVESFSQVGGGSLPGEDLPTICLSLVPASISVDTLAARLRANDPPVFGRIQSGALLLDPRTLDQAELPIVADAVATSLQEAG